MVFILATEDGFLPKLLVESYASLVSVSIQDIPGRTWVDQSALKWDLGGKLVYRWKDSIDLGFDLSLGKTVFVNAPDGSTFSVLSPLSVISSPSIHWHFLYWKKMLLTSSFDMSVFLPLSTEASFSYGLGAMLTLSIEVSKKVNLSPFVEYDLDLMKIGDEFGETRQGLKFGLGLRYQL